MHRKAVILPFVLILIALATAPAFTAARLDIQVPEGIVGVSGGAIGSGLPEAAPGYELSLRRATFEPGGSVALHHHPGSLVLYIESGNLTYTVFEGEADVVRAADEGTPSATERIGPDSEVVLTAGDWLFEQNLVHTAVNAGDTPTVVWIAALADTEHDFTMFD
jgi:hypothetical protein